MVLRVIDKLVIVIRELITMNQWAFDTNLLKFDKADIVIPTPLPDSFIAFERSEMPSFLVREQSGYGLACMDLLKSLYRVGAEKGDRELVLSKTGVKLGESLVVEEDMGSVDGGMGELRRLVEIEDENGICGG